MRMQQARRMAARLTLVTMSSALMFGGLAAVGGSSASAAPVTRSGTVGGLSVDLSVNDDHPEPGGLVVFTYTFTNNSPDGRDFRAVAVNMEHPASQAYSLESCTGFDFCQEQNNPAFDEHKVRSETSLIQPGGSIVATVSLRIASSAAQGETFGFTINMEFFSNQPIDPLFLSFDPITFTVTGNRADLAVDLDAGPKGALITRILYTLNVHNNGPSAAANATVTTRLPIGLVWAGSATCTFAPSSRNITCPVGGLATGGTSAQTFEAVVGLLTIGPLRATAVRTASTPADPNPANDSSTAVCYAVTTLFVQCPAGTNAG